MRVGLFLRNLDEEYQINVFRGVRARAQAQGIDLVCIQGETIHPSNHQGPRAFALAHDVAFDGLLILSSVIVDSSDSRKAASVPSLLPPVPAVSLGLAIPGVPSLSIQSQRSVSRVMEHLILDHGYRRFLFVGGPAAHRDSQVRERAFLRTIAEFQVTWPEITAVVDHGAFSEPSGIDVVRAHLSGPPFDAVVAANDNMALGILKVLRSADDPRWHQCAVTGVDDTPQARLSDPALTTIRQPLDALGAQALDTLVRIISGAPVPAHQTLTSEPVIRESCGCRPHSPGPLVSMPQPRGAELEDRLAQVRRLWLGVEQRLRDSNDFGRDLSAVSTPEALVRRLDSFLESLGVRDFFLLAHGRLWYERRGRQRTALPGGGLPMGPQVLFSQRLVRETGTPWNLCAFDLESEGVNQGLAVYSVEDPTLPHVASALPHVAHALKRIQAQAEQEDRSRQLEARVLERTQELTRANEALRDEIRARRAAEAEVLQVSEYERRRFGLDLHDDICQRLAGLSMYLRGFVNQPPEDPRPLLTEVGALVDETLQLTRQYAHASYPIELERRGLDEVLRSLCDTVGRQRGIPCRYASTLSQIAPVGGLPALNLYRIVQEALQNALKHSRATRIEVSVDVSRSSLILTVADNGTGQAPGGPDQGGLGSRSMTYRAAQLGAQFSRTGRPGMGTVVRVEVPLSRLMV